MRLLILAVTGLPVLASCAELRVDVDVYKGPLANHEEVLTEQFAITASAARPVLVQLRDALARSHMEICEIARNGDQKLWNEKQKTLSCPVQIAGNGNRRELATYYELHPAKHIENILALYEDDVTSLPQAFLDELVVYSAEMNAGDVSFEDTVALVDHALGLMIELGDDNGDTAFRILQERRVQMIDLMAQVLSATMEPQTIAVLEEGVQRQTGKEARLQSLKGLDLKADSGDAATNLYNALIREPKEVAGALQYLRRQTMFNAAVAGSSGIVRVMDRKNGWVVPLIEQAAIQAKIIRSKGFGQARLHEGLDTLIRTYLDGDDRRNSCKLVACNSDIIRLQKALVRFAEKVTYAANYGELANRDFGREVFDVHKFQLTLQALGNTLVVYANELSLSRSFRERRKDAYNGELLAAQQYGRRGTAQIYEALEKDLVFRRKSIAGDQAGAKSEEQKNSKELENTLAKAREAAQAAQAALQSAGLPAIDQTKVSDAIDFKDTNNRQAAFDAVEPLKKRLSPPTLYSFFKAQSIPDGRGDPVAQETFADSLYKLLLKQAEQEQAADDLPRVKSLAAIARSDGFKNSKICGCAESGTTATPNEWLKKLGLYLFERQAEEKLAEQSLTDFERRLTALAKAQERREAAIRKKMGLEKRIQAIDVAIVAARMAKGAPVPAEGSAPIDYVAAVHAQIDVSGEPQITKKDVVTELKFWTPVQAGGVADDQTGREKTDQAVLEASAQQLQHAYIQAIADFGPNSPYATHLQAAIKAMQDYRSGKVMLQPPTAYLRSGLAASALQSGADTEFKGNRLGAHFWDTIKPWNKRGDDEELRIQLDTQFWQNINRVRVAGGGSTNYAIAKDPAGNWYVKGYSSDPQAVFKSAEGLARYYAGQKRNLDLNNLGDDGKPSSASPVGLEKTYAEFRKRYEQHTEADRTSLLKLLAKDVEGDVVTLRKQVNNIALQKDDPNELGKKMEGVYEAEFAAIRTKLEKAAPDQERAVSAAAADVIIEALQAMHDFKGKIALYIVQDIKVVPRPDLKTAKPCPTEKDGQAMPPEAVAECNKVEEGRVKAENDANNIKYEQQVAEEKRKAVERANRATELVSAEIAGYMNRRRIILDELENASKVLLEVIN